MCWKNCVREWVSERGWVGERVDGWLGVKVGGCVGG